MASMMKLGTLELGAMGSWGVKLLEPGNPINLELRSHQAKSSAGRTGSAGRKTGLKQERKMKEGGKFTNVSGRIKRI